MAKVTDFEQQIFNCWNITDDLKTLSEGVVESDLTTDQIANVLFGLEELYELKFQKLFEMFDEYSRANRPKQEV